MVAYFKLSVPFCNVEDFEIEKKELVTGKTSVLYRVTRFKIAQNKIPFFDLSKKIVFKQSNNILQKSFVKLGFSNFTLLKELKYSLFYNLQKCPYLHLVKCLVVSYDLKKGAESIAVGYLSEEAEFGSLDIFLTYYRLIDNYGIFLDELVHIAEGVKFLHERRIIHQDIHDGNILVFSIIDENNNQRLSLKLGDLEFCSMFDEINCKTDRSFNKLRESALKIRPELERHNSFEDKLIMHGDWVNFISLVEKVLGNMKQDFTDLKFENIAKLVELIKGNEYWKLDDIFKTIKEYFDKEIEACQFEGPLNIEKREIK